MAPEKTRIEPPAVAPDPPPHLETFGRAAVAPAPPEAPENPGEPHAAAPAAPAAPAPTGPVKYRIALTDRIAPGQPQVVLHLGRLRFAFTRQPAAEGEADVHEGVVVPRDELWRLPGMVDDGWEITPPPDRKLSPTHPRPEAPPNGGAEPAPAGAPPKPGEDASAAPLDLAVVLNPATPNPGTAAATPKESK